MAFLMPGLFVVLALSYSLIVPAWEAPDENLHFDYVRHLLLEAELPVQQAGEIAETHQPPLYYVIAALFALPADVAGERGALRSNPAFIGGQAGPDINRGLHGSAETFPYREQALALHLMRLASVAMGAVTVFLVLRMGWELFPARPQIGILVAGLVAFNPQFLFISSSINNDNLLVLAATGTWWQLLRAVRQKQRWRPCSRSSPCTCLPAPGVCCLREAWRSWCQWSC
jgi:4-amino-4-deoxy-L-arabinose transferase-like glycosyltransferase